MPAYVKTVWATGDIITAAKLNNAENGIAASLPKDGSDSMTGGLTIKNAQPFVLLWDTTAGQPGGEIRVQDGFLYVDHCDNNGTLVATRIKIDLTSGTIYVGATLDKALAVRDGTAQGSLNADQVDGFNFRLNGGILEYSQDGFNWSTAGLPAAQVRRIARLY